jgi:hypothetical protein
MDVQLPARSNINIYAKMILAARATASMMPTSDYSIFVPINLPFLIPFKLFFQ